VKFLFTSFLKKKNVYYLNIIYWDRYINKSLMENDFYGEKYLSVSFSSGELFFDGNPIYNAKILGTKKTFRIVQENQNEFENYYTSFFNEIEIQGSHYVELVIVLTLTKESRIKAINEIITWLKI